MPKLRRLLSDITIFMPVNECIWCGEAPHQTRYKNKLGEWKYRTGCRGCRDFTKYFASEVEAVTSWNNDESILSAKGPKLDLKRLL